MTYLMNPHTGDVDTKENWEIDWTQKDIECNDTLEEWMGHLIEVEKDEDGSWVEKD